MTAAMSFDLEFDEFIVSSLDVVELLSPFPVLHNSKIVINSDRIAFVSVARGSHVPAGAGNILRGTRAVRLRPRAKLRKRPDGLENLPVRVELVRIHNPHA